MALPDAGGQFPPKPFDEAQKDFKTWNAWYTGSPADLETIYASNNMMRQTVMPGGIMGRLAKFFWGRPNLQSSSKLHIPAAADLARSSADLLFSQPPKFAIAEDDTAAGDAATKRLDLMFNSDEAASTFLESAEICSALGGTYNRLWWDDRIADHVMIGAVAADAAIPTWTYNHLTAVTFWTTVLDDNGIVLRHLERHESGRIIHGLYQGDQGHLGRKVPLTEVDATEWAANAVDQDGAILTGVDELTASYVPNVRPNRRWRTKPGLTQLGRSDFDGLEQLFDALDEAYTSWMRDLDLGKARLFVDEGLLINSGPGKGGMFDSDQAIFTPLREQLGDASGGAASSVQANQFAIRWQEHSQTCAEILNAILRGAGLSSNNFSDSSLTVGVPTATEVNSKDKLSERTRDKKINYWKAGLRPLAKTAMDIDAELFGTGIALSELPELKFPTRSTQSPAELSASIATLRTANAMSIEQAVKERNPNWSTDEQDDEVARIKQEMKDENSFSSGGDFGGTDDTEFETAA
ncbi:phage portal protein [Rhodococcoides fascians]|uniref:phage portal protein n=1 Tax=Rhodococcoides fascians TaxID=1828 RepID=UPI000AFB015C|nr:phage portal protein [Rhodococcus fascians]